MMDNNLDLEEKYRDAYDYLLDYAHEDWVGFSVISGHVASLTGSGVSLEARVPVFRKLISDLLDAGVSIGDFESSKEAPFVAWKGAKEDHLARVVKEIRELGKMPMSGDIGWLFFVDS